MHAQDHSAHTTKPTIILFGNLMKKQIPNAKVSRTITDNQPKKNLVLPCIGSSHDDDDDDDDDKGR